MSVIIGLISGLLSGIISSIIANIIFRKSKPKLIISDKIAKNVREKNCSEYRIKVVNLSKRYVKNLKFQARLITPGNGVGGIKLHITPIEIMYSNIEIMDPYNIADNDARYAIRIRLDENLELLWAEDNQTYLELQIYGENEFNGSGKVFRKVYNKKSHSIVLGEFETKESMVINKL